jgi:hypothetical protein
MDNEKIFVGVRNQRELRKNLLESSRLVLQDLKKYQDFKAIKTKKAEKISSLKLSIKEIKRLISKLKLSIPKIEEFKEQKKERPQNKQLKLKEEPKKETQKKARTELDVLEDELKRIETKLSSME